MELSDYREKIDEADRALIAAFVRRMELSAEVAACKKAKGLPVFDPVREAQKLDWAEAQVPEVFAGDVRALYETLFALSKGYQNRLLEK